MSAQGQKRCFECASAASAIVPIALPNCCIAAAPGETAEAEEIDEPTRIGATTTANPERGFAVMMQQQELVTAH